MGLIKAGLKALGSTLGDQWLEFIYCDTLQNDVLMRKGMKRTAAGSSNTKGSDNIITQGSRVAVNEGQFLLVVDQGKVIDFTAEPGEYIFDKSTEPSLFYGGFGQGLLNSFKRVGARFTFGGDTGHDQRVYFVNSKLIQNNKFGTRSPIPFRDGEWQRTINITCFGTYVYRVVDPLLFYANLAGNVSYEYRADEIAGQFKSDLIAALNPALASVAAQRVSYDMLPGAAPQITAALQEVLRVNWGEKVGINVDRVSIENVAPTEEDAAVIKKLQEPRVFEDGSFAQAAQRRAVAGMAEGGGQGAAQGGPSGQPRGGASDMMAMAMMQNMMNQQMGNAAAGNGPAPAAGGAPAQPYPPVPQNPFAAAPAGGEWTCECGQKNTGKFCEHCGKPRPQDGVQQPAAPTNAQWTCECGAVNSGKFCTECGKPKPVVKRYRCDKCGWTPADPEKPPRFCPECGDIFNDSDAQ